ncbi:MAG: transglycosylase domain-containing protein, partial [Nitrospirota bacterium]
LIIFILVALIYEWRTSIIQSWVYSNYAKKLHFNVGRGPSPSIVFPEEGPFNKRRGYVRIPAFIDNLEKNNYLITRQARFSPELANAVREGISPPYEEKSAAGLTILDRLGIPLYESVPNERIYTSFEDIPEDVIKILLFIENRELLSPMDESQNPVLEWDRMAKAGIKFVGSKIGLPTTVEGGSTLATQLEKYQHSVGGRTGGAKEKIRQITSASLRVYRTGRDTTVSRREIVTDYINTVPLASVAGYGEVHGLGEGLWAWFNTDIRELSDVLRSSDISSSGVAARAEAYKKVMVLFLSVKAPTFYLITNKQALKKRLDMFTDLMLKEGEISVTFHNALKAAPVELRAGRIDPPVSSAMERKAPNSIRYHLLKVLALPGFYDLDRLDLTVHSTMDSDVQKKVAQMLSRLKDPEYVKSAGLLQERMLEHGDPKEMIYSFVLYEKTDFGNALRVQADNLDKPLNINEGVKLDMGSTAKLRTLAHYLQIIAGTYEQLKGREAASLRSDPLLDRDPITRWIVQQMTAKSDITLNELLEASMQRKYSGNPGEVFFTGGGQHTFVNFKKTDNRIMTLYEGLQNSVNLVFIRLMRDLVYYHMARLDVDTKAILEDQNYPDRQKFLKKIADDESREFLSGFVVKYRGLTIDQSIERLLGTKKTSQRHLAILFYSLHPSASQQELYDWLKQRRPEVPDLSEQTAARLARAYGRPELTISDYGYLISRHPLELWTIGRLQADPKVEWKVLIESSADAREQTGKWLLLPRNKKAQDLRLKILFEKMAFVEMHKEWKKLGYPFNSLVASYATAIGSSADRPSALAELMGIIVNDGVHMPSLKVTSLHFAKDTPYETELQLKTDRGQRVMPAEVAAVLKKALAGVVEGGTARRVYGVLKGPGGTPVVIGGKTGTGDNRFETYAKGGKLISSRVVNRTATFVFYIGDRHFGVVTAFMPGKEAADYSFTSSLPVQVLRLLAPELKPLVLPEA